MLTLQGCAVTCRLINSVLSVVRLVPTAPTAMIKRKTLKGREALPNSLQILPGSHPHTINYLILTRTDALLTPCLTLWLGLSQVRKRFSLTFSLSLPSSAFFLSTPLFPKTLVLFPALSLIPPSLSAKASHQSQWLVSNCSAGSILSCFVRRDQNNQHEYGKTCFYGNIQPNNIHISRTNLA